MAQESILRIVIDSRNAERNAHALASELDSIDKKGDFASKSMDGLSIATRQLAGYMAGVVTVGAAINKMDAYTGMRNRLKLVTNSQNELNRAMNDTFGIAQKSYQAWDSVIQVYQRFSDNAKTLKINMTETAQLTETVSKAVAISGASTQAAEAALTQFGQALASGVLRGEELNSILEQTPGLAKAIAQGMGITVGQLRSVAAEGKITGEVLVDALTKSKASVDELFSKTDITIGQSLMLLNNEVTKFVGEASEASGAASIMASSIKILGENLSTIADVAILGGVAALTKAIITKTTAIHELVLASSALKAADLAQKQESLALATLKLNEAKAHLANVQATNAETQAKYGATAANARYKLANDAVTQSLIAQTAAQKALNASTSIASKAFGLIGGWTGVLTLGVTALAAGYMYMKNRTAEATAKLKEQAEAAKLTKEEIKALNDEQRKEKIGDLAATLEDQNKTLRKHETAVANALSSIQQFKTGNVQVAEVVNKAKTGTISYTEAIQQFKTLKIPSYLQDELLKQVNAYDEAAETANKTKNTYKLFGVEVSLAGNKAENAVVGVDKNTKSLSENEKAALAAKNAQKEYADSLSDRRFEALVTKGLLAKGYSPEQVKSMVDTAVWARKNGVAVNNELYQIGLQVLSIEEQNKKVIDAKNRASKEYTDELKKQYKYTQAEERLLAKAYSDVSKSGLGAYAESKGIPANIIAGLYMQESKAGTDLRSHTGALGPWQTTSGYRKDNRISMKDNNDFLKVGKIVVDNIAKEFANSGSLKQAVLSHNAGSAGAAQFMTNGSVNGKSIRKAEVAGYLPKIDKWAAWGSGKKGGLLDSNSSGKDYQDFLKDQIKTLQEIDQLRAKYDSDAIVRSKERIKEISEAERLGQTDLISLINERHDAQDKLAELQLDGELHSYKWSEAQKLEFTYRTNKLRLDAEGKYSDDVKALAKKSLDDQLKQELALLQLAQEQRLFQAKQSFLTETQAMQQRYELERKEIALNSKLSVDERNKLIQLSKAAQDKEMNDRLASASMNWDSMRSQMNGSTGRYQVSQDRFSRMDASQNLFDTQMADVDQQAQEPGADLQKLAEVREQIWLAHNQRMLEIENQYQTDSLNLQLTQAQQLTGSFASMFKGILGESSGAYKLMYQMQQGFAITQAAMNMWSSASSAYSETPGTVWQKMAAAAQATLDQGTFLAMIQSITPQGFATGGKIYGAGTTTSDSIPIMASNKEFMIKASSAEKIGTDTLNYMNRTGEIPYQEQRQFEAIQAKGKAVSVQPVVNVYTLPGTTAEVTTNADGSLDVRIREIAKAEVRRGFDNLNNPNSHEHKQVTRNTTAKTNRL